ncbi:hypothetical protein IE985_20435 [Klebsiella pneumoniae]|nr:hypothetical protein [Klebsiella pneumoniae]
MIVMVETSCSAVPSVPGGTDGSVSRAVIAHFCRNFVWLTSSRSLWRKAAQRRLNQQIPRVLHKVIAIDYLPPSGGCAVITVLIINNQDL